MSMRSTICQFVLVGTETTDNCGKPGEICDALRSPSLGGTKPDAGCRTAEHARRMIGTKSEEWSPPKEVLWIGGADLRATVETAILEAAQPSLGKHNA